MTAIDLDLTRSISSEAHVFGPREINELNAFAEVHGYAILRGAFDEAAIDALLVECEQLQQRLIAGDLPAGCGDVVLTDTGIDDEVRPTVHYVLNTTTVSDVVARACHDDRLSAIARSWVGPDAWMVEDEWFGVVYQDARPGPGSAYSRIGWHSDWQSAPQLACWPAVGFTIHLDETSPYNGFLRVVPGSHRWATPAPQTDIDGSLVAAADRFGGWDEEAAPVLMPPGFEKVPGEVAVYAEVGDVLFHDAYLWHSAARGTDDGTLRRHLRGGWYAGERFPVGAASTEFVKNARR
jgi:Phytanoyl-CoA dioxygenase (PhyH)